MPIVEKVAGGRVNVRGIGHFEVGDRAEVTEDDAAYLCEERGDFERVDDATDVEYTEVEPDVSDEELDDAREEIEDAVTESDDAADERAAELADEHWQHAVSAVEAGEADDYLDGLEAVDDRQSVQDAIEERRDELEG